MTLSNNHPAFPVVAHQNVYSTGMDLRDWFAGMALQGLIPIVGIPCDEVDNLWDLDTAKRAYALADAMLEARKNGQ
jgi:hypothetical protein